MQHLPKVNRLNPSFDESDNVTNGFINGSVHGLLSTIWHSMLGIGSDASTNRAMAAAGD
jgi:hypothetical protein